VNRRTPRSRALVAGAVTLALGLFAAACGDDADSAANGSLPAAETAPADTAPAGTASAGDTAPADDATAFPVTIEHKFGETTIEEEPVRVVSIGFAEHDGILALGVVPVGVRDWYGDQPYGTWPWAQDELGDATPELLPSTELNFEQIAALDPDIILGIGSGMTDADYATLSEIAPTIAQPADYVDYGTPWDVSLDITGRALGRNAEAAAVIDHTNALFAEARAAHPEFEGATAAVAFEYEGEPGAYASADSRSRVLTDLGFVIPEEYDDLAGDSFYFTVSQEDLSVLDTDVVVWIVASEPGIETVRDMPLRPSMRAYAEGREIVTDALLSSAFSHASPLSLEYALEALVPELALAVDGDPTTVVSSAAAIDPGVA